MDDKKQSNKLVIIGNGFDLSHGFKTSYDNFRCWICDNYHELFLKIEKYNELCFFSQRLQGDWANIENALIVDEINHNIEKSNPNNHLIVKKEFYNTIIDLFIQFNEWISIINKGIKKASASFYKKTNKELSGQINLKQMRSVYNKIIKKHDCFVNFNYTKTLEYVYGINCNPGNNVLFIHRCAHENGISDSDDVENKIIFGNKANDGFNKTDYIIKERLNKNVDNNKNRLLRFLSDKNINEIVILGESMDESNGDYEYLKLLLQKFNIERICVSYHNVNTLYEKIKLYNSIKAISKMTRIDFIDVSNKF